MLTSTATVSLSRPPKATPWLICLDLQREYVVPGRPRFDASSADVVRACVGVLDHARRDGWRVAHTQRRPASGTSFEGLFGTPIEGLRPRITEPVFLREGLSAFSSPQFRAEMRDARGADIYLVGFSLADTCLATVLGAVDAGLVLILIEDAIGVSGASGAGAPDIARTLLRPFARTVLSAQIGAAALELA